MHQVRRAPLDGDDARIDWRRGEQWRPRRRELNRARHQLRLRATNRHCCTLGRGDRLGDHGDQLEIVIWPNVLITRPTWCRGSHRASCRAQKLHAGSLINPVRWNTPAAAMGSGIVQRNARRQFENDRSPISTLVKGRQAGHGRREQLRVLGEVFNGQSRPIELSFLPAEAYRSQPSTSDGVPCNVHMTISCRALQGSEQTRPAAITRERFSPRAGSGHPANCARGALLA